MSDVKQILVRFNSGEYLSNDELKVLLLSLEAVIESSNAFGEFLETAKMWAIHKQNAVKNVIWFRTARFDVDSYLLGKESEN
jgi:hypothetical protein